MSRWVTVDGPSSSSWLSWWLQNHGGAGGRRPRRGGGRCRFLSGESEVKSSSSTAQTCDQTPAKTSKPLTADVPLETWILTVTWRTPDTKQTHPDDNMNLTKFPRSRPDRSSVRRSTEATSWIRLCSYLSRHSHMTSGGRT